MKQPPIPQLVSVIAAYNTARELELRSRPANGWPADYKNVLLEELYDAAALAAAQLKPILTLPSLAVEPPK